MDLSVRLGAGHHIGSVAVNWEAIGAVGELVGALAVVLTLAYLARQMKQNTVGMRVAAKQEMTRQFSDYTDLLLLNPDLWDINRRGFRGEELSPEEIRKFEQLLSKVAWYFASMYFQYQEHALSDDEWKQSKTLIARYCANPGFREYWRENSDSFSSSFVDYIEGHWKDVEN